MTLFQLTVIFVMAQEDVAPCRIKYPVGKCPKDPSRGSCEENSDCSKADQICCDDGCGPVCQPESASTKPTSITAAPTLEAAQGTCPIQTSVSIFCRYITHGPMCKHHTECGTGKLCCPDKCGKICKTPRSPVPRIQIVPPVSVPIKIHKAPCPYYRYFTYNCKYHIHTGCMGDSDCGPNSRCCRNPCSFACKRVTVIKPGTCPLPPSRSMLRCRYINRCTDDGSCTGGAKCCNHPCGKQCIGSVTIKPGNCGIPHHRSIYCTSNYDICHKDDDCIGATKCCKSPCGNQCRNPASQPSPPKPGICPPKRINVRCVRWQNDCRLDQECIGSSKCCSTGCGVTCVQPTQYLYSG